MRGIHRSPVNSPHKGQWRGSLMLSLICAWINGWVNNGEAGDLRRHRAHYDVIVMFQGNRTIPQVPKYTSEKYPTLNNSVTEMCTHLHISVTKLCFVGHGTGVLWDLCNRSVRKVKTQISWLCKISWCDIGVFAEQRPTCVKCNAFWTILYKCWTYVLVHYALTMVSIKRCLKYFNKGNIFRMDRSNTIEHITP